MLVSDIINQAFLNLGAIAAGETITGDEQSDAFTRLLQMIESWNTEGLSLYQRLVETLTLTGAQSYTIGPTGTFVTARPTRIVAARVTNSTGLMGRALKIATPEEWAGVPLERGRSTVLGQLLFCDHAFPDSTLYLYPKVANASKLELTSIKQLPTFAAVSDTISLPPGYTLALATNLAVILFPQYARPGMGDVIAPLAQAHKASLVDLNRQNFGIVPPGATQEVKQ